MKSASLLIILGLIFALTVNASENTSLEFRGNLLDIPCQLAPDSTGIVVEFRETATSLYRNWPGKSYEQNFSVKLENCHSTTIGKVMKLVFKGTEESSLPGYLAVTGKNNGLLGIGIVDTDGKSLLKLGDAHNLKVGDKITTNSIILNFKAFVQATPKAIEDRSVEPADYSSTATFEIDYK